MRFALFDVGRSGHYEFRGFGCRMLRIVRLGLGCRNSYARKARLEGDSYNGDRPIGCRIRYDVRAVGSFLAVCWMLAIYCGA